MSNSRGFRRKRKVFKLEFEEYDGLEVQVRSVPIRKLLDILQLADAMTGKPTQEQVNGLFGWFADRIISWTYQDEDGNPLPATLETLLDDDFDFVLMMVMAWVKAVSAIAIPTVEAAGPGGGDPVEASIPMSSPAGT